MHCIYVKVYLQKVFFKEFVIITIYYYAFFQLFYLFMICHNFSIASVSFKRHLPRGFSCMLKLIDNSNVFNVSELRTSPTSIEILQEKLSLTISRKFFQKNRVKFDELFVFPHYHQSIVIVRQQSLLKKFPQVAHFYVVLFRRN